MSQLIPMYEPAGNQTKALGFPMAQSRMAPVVWAYAFEQLPPSRIVEIGSGGGGFTVLLAFMTAMTGTLIYSFDTCKAPNEDWKGLADFLKVQFVQEDVFQSGEFPVIAMIGAKGTSYLLCDGGNKIKEFKHFSKYLKPGDVIAAHDHTVQEPDGSRKWWGWTEITPDDVAQTVKECDLEPFMQEHFDTVGWLVFRKRI